MTDLWPRLAALLAKAERPARYINHEWGCTYKPEAEYRFCMVYPDTYEIGQANQAIRILCNAVNAVPHMAAERSFLPAPEFCDLMREAGLPLFSLESCAPLNEFDAVGITLSHELVATNVLETLDLAGIPLHASERSDGDPIIIAGGPCTFNPEPYWPFVDIVSLGEGEESTGEILALHQRLKKEGRPRREILKALNGIEGCYAPGLYTLNTEEEAAASGVWIKPEEPGLPVRFTKRVFGGFAESPGWEPCIVPFAEMVHDRLNVEVLRGCTRGCRFCQAGMTSRPVRERSVENIVASTLEGLAATGYDEVSLTSLSTTDHSQIDAILGKLNHACEGKGIRISIPSQRLDAFGVDMASLVAGQKKGGLTFAPEAGTQRLRDVVNKQVSEDDLFSAVDAAFSSGWRRCKLYFMIGLPTECDDDIKGIASLAQRAYDRARKAVPEGQQGNVRFSISCALFVPKPQTPFQWEGQIAAEEALRRVALLRSSIKYKAIDVHWHDPATSYIEAALSRGGRNAAAWIEEAWRQGARFDAWTEHFNRQAWDTAAKKLALDPGRWACHSYDDGAVLPWAHIDAGLDAAFLLRERQRSLEGATTPDCTRGSCSACGVCTRLAYENHIQGERHD